MANDVGMVARTAWLRQEFLMNYLKFVR